MKSTDRTLLSHLPLGDQINEKMLTNILPNEMVFEHENHLSVFCLWPRSLSISGFENIFNRIKINMGEGRVLPVYYLVCNGVFGNYFVVFMRR